MNDRADSRPNGQVPKKFCASPWVEGLLRMNGHFATCCKNPTSFGDWTKDGLEQVWRSDSFQEFRRDVADGQFPDRFCASCFKNGTAQSIRQLTQKPLFEYLKDLRKATARGFLAFTGAREIWHKSEFDDTDDKILASYRQQIETCEQLVDRGLVAGTARSAVDKLRVVGAVAHDFRQRKIGAISARPLRPSELISFCITHLKNGSAKSIRQRAEASLVESLKELREANARGFAAINRARTLWEKSERDPEADAILADYFQQLDICELLIDRGHITASARLTVNKLRVLGKILRDFLNGEAQPEVVAPLRQSNLIAICNARCIHCPGLFSKEIELGARINDTEHFREMTADQVDKSFARQNDIIDFFMNGSEFLFAKNWPTVAERLKQEGVRVRVSTNGMLLTEKNARLLIDNNYLGKLNLSLDGATPATIERVRARVKYDRVMSNLKFMMPYAAEKNADFRLSLSFALLDSNYHELPDFVVLAESVRKLNPKICPTIMVQQLSLKGVPSYGEFVAKHHPSLIDREALVDSFKRMHQVAQQHNIPVYVFHTYTLSDFIAEGCPVPSMEFQSNTAPQLEDEFVEAAAG